MRRLFSFERAMMGWRCDAVEPWGFEGRAFYIEVGRRRSAEAIAEIGRSWWVQAASFQ